MICMIPVQYTMKQFLEDYMTKASTVQDEQQRLSIQKLQSKFSITSIKVLLVSLLNAFRDLTLMGVQVSWYKCDSLYTVTVLMTDTIGVLPFSRHLILITLIMCWCREIIVG